MELLLLPSLYWLTVPGANEMDGAVGVTQCTIAQKDTFTYKFKIQDYEHGTFWSVIRKNTAVFIQMANKMRTGTTHIRQSSEPTAYTAVS